MAWGVLVPPTLGAAAQEGGSRTSAPAQGVLPEQSSNLGLPVSALQTLAHHALPSLLPPLKVKVKLQSLGLDRTSASLGLCRVCSGTAGDVRASSRLTAL